MIPIQITTDTIKETKTYKSLSFMNKGFLRKSKKEISNGVNISLNRGYEIWEKQAHASYQVKEIVREIINGMKK